MSGPAAEGSTKPAGSPVETARDPAARVRAARSAVEPVVHGFGLELYDLVFTGRGHAAVVQVLVDRPGGVDLDTLASLSEALLPVVGHGPTASCALEVSSPGIERPLRRREHFAGAVGELVSAVVREADGVARVRGVLRAADEHGVRIEIEGAERVVTYDAIERARTVFEWQPAPKPGRGSKPGHRKRGRLARPPARDRTAAGTKSEIA